MLFKMKASHLVGVAFCDSVKTLVKRFILLVGTACDVGGEGMNRPAMTHRRSAAQAKPGEKRGRISSSWRKICVY